MVKREVAQPEWVPVGKQQASSHVACWETCSLSWKRVLERSEEAEADRETRS